MIGAAIRRSLVDLWDNAIVVFSLNLAFLCLTGLVLWLASLTLFLPSIITAAGFLLATALILMALVFAAGLIEQVALHADISLPAMMPDLGFTLAGAATSYGLIFMAGLLFDLAGPVSAISVARLVLGVWFLLVAVQTLVLVPALALDRSRSMALKLFWLMSLSLRFPVGPLLVGALSAAGLAATVGLLPGPAGAAYLFLRTGRLMTARFDPMRDRLELTQDELAALLVAETRTLRNRTPRNLLQPWRPAS